MVFLIITYLLPIVSMTYAYTRIGMELWGSQSIGECTQRQMENIKSKRRVSSLQSTSTSIRTFRIESILIYVFNLLQAHSLPGQVPTCPLQQVLLPNSPGLYYQSICDFIVELRTRNHVSGILTYSTERP